MSFPNFLTFHSIPVFLEASGEKATPTFNMVAYTGGKMRVDGFPHPVVVEFSGLEISSQSIPIRLDHKPYQGVGHTTKIAIANNELMAEGLISRDTNWARDVANSGTKGFPWKASIGGPILEAEFVPQGNFVEVNGQKFEGPVHVIRKMTLKEISFVDNAADSNTSATVQAQNKTEDIPTSSATAYSMPTPAILEGNVIEDFQKQIRAAALEETNRIETIRSIANGEQSELEAKAIKEGWSPDKFELHFLRSARPTQTPPRAEPQRPMQLVLEAIAMQAGGLSLHTMEKRYSEPVLEAADKYRGVKLLEFCEIAHGQPLPRYASNSCDWIQAAFSTTSLPNLLTSIANKMLLEGYNYIDDSWRRICKIASVNNFQQHSRHRMIGEFKFEKIGEGGELKHGKLSEQKYTQKADTYGIMFGLTREMIINDDLSALSDVPRNVGLGAGEAITDKVWELLLSNPTIDDGKAFFHKDHKNYQDGAGTTLNVDGLTLAEIAFMEQTKPNGRPLGLPASILLVPTALKVVAEMLMKATTLNETTPENVPKVNTNPHTGKYEVVSTSYLSNAGFKNSSSKAWYLFADPNRVPALEVAFLGGQDRPTVERADADFNTLGFQYRGYLDFGVKEQDHRGALKMKGEA